MKIDRREFVELSAGKALAAGSVAALGVVPGEAEAEKPAAPRSRLPIVDTHQHLWDLDRFRLPWLKSAEQLNRSFLPKDYHEAAKGLNLAKTVYMEVDVAVQQQSAEAEYVIELCKRADNPMAAAVIGGRPGLENFRQYITRFKDSPHIKGVRQILHGPELCRDEPFMGGIRLLGELGMSFDLCMPPTELRAGAELVDRCPDTRFILDHCGNADPKAFRPKGNPRGREKATAAGHDPDQWRRDIDRLAQRKNVVCKISGIVAGARKGNWAADDLAPIVNHCLDAFGPDRVMFGGDWPVCTRVATLRRWVDALAEVIRGRSESQRRKLWHDNAVRFYGL